MPHYKILVIDYEPRGLAQLRDPLHAAGYLVTVAHDGQTGMRLFEELKPDLTLIEAMLPKKHGFEVCLDMKKTPHGKNSPVVIVTSVYRGRKYRNQALHNYHCDEFLEKPIASDFLLETVERLLKARAPKPEPVAPVRAKPEPKRAAPAQPPAPPPAEAPPVEVEDETELEISERLDELLGGGPSSGPKASAAATPRAGENLLSFDPDRGRKPTDIAESTGSPVGTSSSSSIGRAHGNAEPVRSEQAYHAVGDRVPTHAPEQAPEIRRQRAHAAPAPIPARGIRNRWILYLTILVVAAASTAAFLLLWPL